MTAALDLYVSTDASNLTADLRLQDAAGNHLAWRQVRLADHPASRWEGLFDLRGYVKRYAGNTHPLGESAPLDEASLIRALGVFLGREVLGGRETATNLNLMAHLDPGKRIEQRTLRVRLPAQTQVADRLAAAFARIPWEIARSGPQSPTLAERTVLIRALTCENELAPGPLHLRDDEPLRLLLVFAEAPGSRPLAARLERQRLLALFRNKICPHRRVVVDALCHGVTRERLVKQIERAGGYHIVHWSGHGHLNLLELYAAEGETPRLTGQQLVQLFGDAGGYVPRLMFLGTCHSGNLLDLGDWTAFQAVLEGRDPEGTNGASATAAGPLAEQLEDCPGYTGTAHALLDAGVPTLVAMRYEVGDDYCRDLALGFYERLLGGDRPKRPDEALNQARRHLLQAAQQGGGHNYGACDHATPLLFGAADPGLMPSRGHTPPPAVHPPLRIRELEAHRDFVGRSREMAQLGARWLDSEDQCPVAVIRGLGGLGKTALTAEAIDVWHSRFRWVFVFQAKPIALKLDEFLLQLHLCWVEQQGDYTTHVKDHAAEAIWRQNTDTFKGPQRQEALRRNLVRALVREPVLLVLDNFEPCLVPRPASGAEGHRCQDPEWDALLAALAEGLAGSNSRVLLTSRWPLAALADPVRVLDLLLGPLPPGEAALYAHGHTALRKLYFQPGGAGRELVMRLLHASRGHPLLLDRLARLVECERDALKDALERLEKEGLAQLPQFFLADPRNPDELHYLEDALAGSIDLLLERVGPDARRLLWVLSLANEPVTADLWLGVWCTAQAGQESGDPSVPDCDALQRMLVQSGLVTENSTDAIDPEYTCHELVRECIAAWMSRHELETTGRSAEQIWASYGDQLAAEFNRLLARDQRDDALKEGVRALRYCVRSRALEKLRSFAGRLVNSTQNPEMLRALLPELEEAAALAPNGERLSARLYLADALGRENPASSLSLYAAISAEARQTQAWRDLTWCIRSWALALASSGQIEASRQKHLQAIEIAKRAKLPAMDVVASELGVLRTDLARNQAAQAWPGIETRLERLRNWWQRYRRGEQVPEAPDYDLLSRVFVDALDTARSALVGLGKWSEALERSTEEMGVLQARGASEHEMANSRYQLCELLYRLGRPDAAQRELEACLEVFDNAKDPNGRARTLSGLALVFDAKGDVIQATGLMRRALDLHNMRDEPLNRANCHLGLGLFLHRLSERSEAASHELAAFLYWHILDHKQRIQIWANNRVVRFCEDHQARQEYPLPRVAELVVRPDFSALRDWLAAAQANLEKLQQAVDTFSEQCHESAKQFLAKKGTS